MGMWSQGSNAYAYVSVRQVRELWVKGWRIAARITEIERANGGGCLPCIVEIEGVNGGGCLPCVVEIEGINGRGRLPCIAEGLNRWGGIQRGGKVERLNGWAAIPYIIEVRGCV